MLRVLGLAFAIAVVGCASQKPKPETHEVVFLKPGEEFPGPMVDKNKIRETVVRGMKDLKKCYEKEIGARPDSKGKVVAFWIIHAKGGVKSERLLSTDIKAKSFQDCMLNTIASWTFEPPPEAQEADITYPFSFDSQK